MTDTDRKAVGAVIESLCDKLEEFGDSVLVLVSAANHADGTSDFVAYGRGNLYAQLGMCRELLLKEESKTRAYWGKQK